MNRSSGRTIAAALLALSAAACGTGTREIAPAAPAPAAAAQPRYEEADVRFLQGMIPHHAQALAMAALVPSRTDNQGVRLIAERIAVSQQDEIAAMQKWLRDHGLAVPEVGEHQHHGDHVMMAGMLSPAELERLAAASGPAFDRLFLQYMIRHHEGALAMVRELLATPGAGQEVDIYRIASEVEADQMMEIERLRRLLAALG